MIFTADMIPKLLAILGWTQKELAEAVGASEQQMTRWMRGRGSNKMRTTHREGFVKVCKQHSLKEKDLV